MLPPVPAVHTTPCLSKDTTRVNGLTLACFPALAHMFPVKYQLILSPFLLSPCMHAFYVKSYWFIISAELYFNMVSFHFPDSINCLVCQEACSLSYYLIGHLLPITFTPHMLHFIVSSSPIMFHGTDAILNCFTSSLLSTYSFYYKCPCKSA